MKLRNILEEIQGMLKSPANLTENKIIKIRFLVYVQALGNKLFNKITVTIDFSQEIILKMKNKCYSIFLKVAH